jgi:hypothetical protein
VNILSRSLEFRSVDEKDFRAVVFDGVSFAVLPQLRLQCRARVIVQLGRKSWQELARNSSNVSTIAEQHTDPMCKGRYMTSVEPA